MKKTKTEIPRSRAHRVLFLHDSPYKPRVVELKKRYRRRAKHIKQSPDQ